MDYMTFPWEQLGLLLRRLSLSGSFGNAAAWILFLATGALPLLAAAVLLRTGPAGRTSCWRRFRQLFSWDCGSL